MKASISLVDFSVGLVDLPPFDCTPRLITRVFLFVPPVAIYHAWISSHQTATNDACLDRQILLVHITAINAFVLVHRRRALEFGLGDHRLLLVVYGLPAILAVNLAVSGQLGPSGAL